MLSAFLVLAAESSSSPSALWQILGPILVALIALPPAVYTARTTLRASNHANATAAARNEQDRDATLDARVDATNALLWQRLDAAEAKLRGALDERDQLAERCARLRLFIIGLGFDPDTLTAMPPPPTPGATGAHP